MSLPVISNQAQLLQYLQNWRGKINGSLKTVRTPTIPWNFQLKTQQGGNLLTWAQVSGSDGYEILRSDSGDFSDGSFVIIPVASQLQTSYFDPVSNSGGGAPPKKYYKIRATAGTSHNPQSVKGLPSGMVSGTAIAASDVVTAPTQVVDTSIDDDSQSFTRYGQNIF